MISFCIAKIEFMGMKHFYTNKSCAIFFVSPNCIIWVIQRCDWHSICLLWLEKRRFIQQMVFLSHCCNQLTYQFVLFFVWYEFVYTNLYFCSISIIWYTNLYIPSFFGYMIAQDIKIHKNISSYTSRFFCGVWFS